MSIILAQIQAEAAAIAEVSHDFNEAVSGGGASRLLKEGPVVARLVSYVDYGFQPQEFQGKAKDPANEFRLGFALYGPDYQNEDGTPYVIETWGITETYNSKSGAFLLFRAMNWKNLATSFPQLIGQLFIVDIVTHTAKKEGAKPRSIINMKTVRAALDPMTSAEYQVPPVPDSYYQLFSMAKPTLTAWDALFRDGTWDDGGSKNRVQETILGSLKFAGSELEALLLGSGRSFVVPAKPVKTAAAAPATPAPAVPASAPVVAQPAPLAQAPAAAPAAAPVVVEQSAPIVLAPVIAPEPTAVLAAVPAGPTTSPSEVAAPVVAAPVVPAPVVAAPVVNLPPALAAVPAV